MKAKLKEGWVPKWKQNLEKQNVKERFPTYMPSATNKMRNQVRAAQREQFREMIRKQRHDFAEQMSKEA